MAGRLDYTTCEPFRSWNRLEPRPRASEFDRVLKAEVHDALWMLTRQWQFGEFKGEDTGSAVLAKVQIETTKVNRFLNRNGSAVIYDDSMPLETRVERMPVQYDLRFRARAGQYWIKLLATHGADYNDGAPGIPYVHAIMKQVFLDIYTFELPTVDQESDETLLQVAKARLLSNRGVHQAISGLAGRSVDGVAWFDALNAAGAGSIPDAITDHADYHLDFQPFFVTASQEYMDWFQGSHERPSSAEDSSWEPPNLEYKFACSMPNKGAVENTLLDASEYYHGHLDWYAFDLNLGPDSTGLAETDPAEETAHVKTRSPYHNSC